MKKAIVIIILLMLAVVSVFSVAKAANLNIRANIVTGDGPQGPTCDILPSCNQDCNSCSCQSGLFCYDDPQIGKVCRNPMATSSPSCINDLVYINIHLTPEKRKPYASPDLTMEGKIEITPAGQSQPIIPITFITGPSGWTQAGVPFAQFPTLPGSYDIYIKGGSYLRKKIAQVDLVNKANQEIDGVNQIDSDAFPTGYYRDYFPDEPPCPFPGSPCTGSNGYLLAGDVSSQKDNYVNGLDFGVMEDLLYQSDKEADLDFNGAVNGLDFSIAEFNIYKRGQ
ncbi:MAG: hypothetical protein WCV92_00545 [Candidatus Buchananbacteria bacterium]